MLLFLRGLNRGHNGREEITTMCLIPNVSKNVNIPVIAAGGIGSGKINVKCNEFRWMVFRLVVDLVASVESLFHINFKEEVLKSKRGRYNAFVKAVNSTVRLLNNDFYQQVKKAEDRGDSVKELQDLLGRGRSKKGMFEGDVVEGELK